MPHTLDDCDVKMMLAEGMAKLFMRDLIKDGYIKEEAELEVEASISRIKAASLLVIACSDHEGYGCIP